MTIHSLIQDKQFIWAIAKKALQQLRLKTVLKIVRFMPKLKTRKAAAKRFRRSGSGKIMRRKAFKNHLLQHKTAKRKSRLSKPAVVNERDAENVELMLPYL
jgi:large subunit ribosomal protein L35